MATRSIAPGAVVSAKVSGARQWPDMISNHLPLSELQSEWRRLITRPSGSGSESDRERASLLWRCLELWTRQLRDVRTVLCQSNDGIAASFYEYRMQFNSAIKKDMPRTQAEFMDSLVYQKSYLESALKIMQPPVAVAPLPRMGARTPTLFPFKNEWPGQIRNFQKLDALARQCESLLVLADQTLTSEDQVKLNGLRADRFRWSRQLDEVDAILAADSDRQNREWDSFCIGAIGSSSSGGSGKQPASFEEYLDSLQFQKWYIGQALVIMDVAAIDGKVARARESSSLGRVSQSACSIM